MKKKRIKKGQFGFKKGSFEEAIACKDYLLQKQKEIDKKQGSNYSGLVKKRVKKKRVRIKK